MKIGVIGLGSVGMRHFNNLLDMGHTVYGYDIETKPSVPTIGWKPEYAKKLDAVVIASPTEDHAQHIKDCEAVPTLAEKPIIGADHSGHLDCSHVKMVGYNLRFHPCVQQAKEWIDEDIGFPTWANFVLGQHSIKPPYLRDGVILNWSHEVDLSLHLLGPADLVQSSTLLEEGRDILSDILLTHENGCRSFVHLDYLTKPEVRQSIIVGTKGTVILDLVSHNAWLRNLDGEIADAMKGEGWDQTYIAEMHAFIRMVEGKDDDLDNCGCTAEEALAVLDICHEVRKQAGL